MSKNEKPGSDGYSRTAFEAGLEKLDQAGFLYQSPSVERSADEEWNLLKKAASDSEKKTIDTLDRLHANAHAQAIKEDLHREYLEFLPDVEGAKGEIHEVIAGVSEVAPGGALREASDVVRMGDELEEVLKSETPVHPRSFVHALIKEFLKAKDYIIMKLRQWLGGQNRFGGPMQSA